LNPDVLGRRRLSLLHRLRPPNPTALSKDGSLAERLSLVGENPTDCAFAPSGKTPRVTEVERDRVAQLATSCGGLSLQYPETRRTSRLMTAIGGDRA
jgi:hypothetical protein